MNRQSNRFKIYPFPKSPASDQYRGKDYLLDGQNRLFAPSPGRLIEFDIKKHTFQVWTYPGIGLSGKIETYYGTQLVQRTNGELLLGAARKILAFNPKTHQFRSIPIPGQLDIQAGLLYQSNQGPIYFTYGMSVYRLTEDDRITLIWTAPRIDYQNYFHALLVDRSGVLWIGTNGDGIQQIDLRALPFKSYPYKTNFINDVLTKEVGLSMPEWAKTDSHLYNLRLDGAVPFLSIYLNQSYQLLRGNRSGGTLRSVLKLPPSRSVSGVDGGNGLKILPNGTVWMYDAHRGLIRADPSGRLLDIFACSLNWVTDLQPLGDQIWVGAGENGLYAYDIKSRRVVGHLQYQPTDSTSLISNHVLCLAPDPVKPAVLWIGTMAGLSRLDTHTMRFRNWTEEQGLPSGTINALLTDPAGNFWFSTVKGISRMNPQTGQFRHFTTADGLLDIEYRQNHAIRLPDGRMAFGGATGITVFDPLAINERVQPIPTALTRLRLGNLTTEFGQKDSPLTVPLNATSNLRLKPNQNFLSLEFAGLQYNKPTRLRYRYQLIGVDPDWVYSGFQNMASYTQLAPGDYQFRVNVSDASGIWSPLIKKLDIVVEAPWWRTWWFYLLVTMASLLSMYGLYRYRLAQVLKFHNLRNDIARDLHDEVGSSISTIAIYSKLVLQQVESNAFTSEPMLVKITEQASEIMESMSDIVWSINTKNDAFDKIFIRMREHAFELFEAKGYALHFEFDENLFKAKLDMEKRRNFYLIYKEALNNIAKYANGQNVWIYLHLQNSVINLTIRDDGQGFDLNTVQQKNNGLKNMTFRAAALKGKLRIVSVPAIGTTIYLSF